MCKLTFLVNLDFLVNTFLVNLDFLVNLLFFLTYTVPDGLSFLIEHSLIINIHTNMVLQTRCLVNLVFLVNYSHISSYLHGVCLVNLVFL